MHNNFMHIMCKPKACAHMLVMNFVNMDSKNSKMKENYIIVSETEEQIKLKLAI